jgi:hypothetical protein
MGIPITASANTTNRQAAKDLAKEYGVETRGKSTDEMLQDVADRKRSLGEDIGGQDEFIRNFEKQQTDKRRTPPAHTQPEKATTTSDKKNQFPVKGPSPPLPQPNREPVKFVIPFYCWKDGVLGAIGLSADFAFKPLQA